MIYSENSDFLLTVRELQWDSEILEIKSGFLEIEVKKNSENYNSLEALLSKVLGEASKAGFRFLTAKLPAGSTALVNSCLSKGRLIDTEITFQKYKNNNPQLQKPVTYPEGISFLKTDKYWDEVLFRLADTVAESRFYIDRNIGQVKALKLWKESIYNSCNGRASYSVIGFSDKAPFGLINVFENEGVSDIFLIAVLPEHQGKGLASLMFDFYEQSLDELITLQIVETQLINYQAQKFYCKKGYNNVRAKHTLHFWL